MNNLNEKVAREFDLCPYLFNEPLCMLNLDAEDSLNRCYEKHRECERYLRKINGLFKEKDGN